MFLNGELLPYFRFCPVALRILCHLKCLALPPVMSTATPVRDFELSVKRGTPTIPFFGPGKLGSI